MKAIQRTIMTRGYQASLEQDEVENDVGAELSISGNAGEDEDFTSDDIDDKEVSEENDSDDPVEENEEEITYEGEDSEAEEEEGEEDENNIGNHRNKGRIRSRRKITLIEDEEE